VRVPSSGLVRQARRHPIGSRRQEPVSTAHAGPANFGDAVVLLGSSWLALWAVLATFIPALQPWASGAATAFITGGWPVWGHSRMTRRSTAVLGVVSRLAASTPLHWIAFTPPASSPSTAVEASAGQRRPG